MGPRLRIIAINDVYTLENLPRIATLVKHYREVDPADRVIVTLAGDFVAPSVLSSLDNGFGMVDCMNAVGVDYFILGNHEDDIATEELHKRIGEFNAVGLATNIDFDRKMMRSAVLDVVGPTRTLRVGLVGVVITDEKIYRRVPFGGAAMVDANASAMQETVRLLAAGCASVIPLTHQALADDRNLILAQRSPVFPVLIGGHEHEVTLKQLEGTWLVKAGSDAVHAAVIDLQWQDEAPSESQLDVATVAVRLDDAGQYDEDIALRAKVDKHMDLVRELEDATLVILAPGDVVSSIGTRVRQTSMGTLLCTRLRDALGAEACLINGGGIRGSREYRNEITYGDLKGEVPFDNELVVVGLPGHVLQAALQQSRAQAPAPSGGYLQVDDGVVVDAENNITHLGGEMFLAERRYQVALIRNMLFGLDHVAPLEAFGHAYLNELPPAGSGHQIKIAMVDAFAKELWTHLDQFEDIDSDQDNTVDKHELAAALTRVRNKPPSRVTVEVMMQALDTDGDGKISKQGFAQAKREKKTTVRK